MTCIVATSRRGQLGSLMELRRGQDNINLLLLNLDSSRDLLDTESLHSLIPMAPIDQTMVHRPFPLSFDLLIHLTLMVTTTIISAPRYLPVNPQIKAVARDHLFKLLPEVPIRKGTFQETQVRRISRETEASTVTTLAGDPGNRPIEARVTTDLDIRIKRINRRPKHTRQKKSLQKNPGLSKIQRILKTTHGTQNHIRPGRNKCFIKIRVSISKSP